jgi:IS30 family transposase
VSHETIYRSLYAQTRGVLTKGFQECLPSPRAIRRSRYATQKGLELPKIKNAVSISERPPEVEDRAVPSHWEGDLIAGSNNSYIATLVERHSRFVRLAKVANKDTQSVTTALIKQARKKVTQGALQIPDLGPGIRKVGASKVHHSHKYQCLFL